VCIRAQAYAALGGLESAGLIALSIVVLVHSADESEPRMIRFLAILSIYVTVGFLYFALDSILLENIFQFTYDLSLCLSLSLSFLALSLSLLL